MHVVNSLAFADSRAFEIETFAQNRQLVTSYLILESGDVRLSRIKTVSTRSVDCRLGGADETVM
jgi:hypothetical protein